MYTLVIRYKYSNTVKNLRENAAVMFSLTSKFDNI